MNYQSGLLMLIAGGGIAAAATVFVDYNWGPPTRSFIMLKRSTSG